MALISESIVIAFGLALVGFAVLIIVKPKPSRRFIESFASSARAHYAEQVIRLVVGAALVVHAPAMSYSWVFAVLGWLMVVTAIALLMMPWRWHNRFGEMVIPWVTRHMKLYAIVVFGLGALIFCGVFGLQLPESN